MAFTFARRCSWPDGIVATQLFVLRSRTAVRDLLPQNGVIQQCLDGVKESKLPPYLPGLAPPVIAQTGVKFLSGGSDREGTEDAFICKGYRYASTQH